MASTSEHAGLDDPNTCYLLQAASRIAQCMGRAFAAYLPRLLPLVFALAELDPKLQISDSSDDGDDEAAVVQIKGMGKMRVGTPRLSQCFPLSPSHTALVLRPRVFPEYGGVGVVGSNRRLLANPQPLTAKCRFHQQCGRGGAGKGEQGVGTSGAARPA